MVSQNAGGFVSPAVDVSEARWAVDELAGLIQQVGECSVSGLVLRQAQQELRSLIRSTETTGKVVGPLRIHVAA
ncbi:hypothetical protein [Fimbriiglobus ruber]|uniref:Uncharacterized protein n=1 Tax=Fimbriiglobus ruber TaxID=1908690 RepID=A0A225E1E6_9BACT|nr:hypothetical protein [Fimbriiglobus ruber]OWK47412.1 hypothetical protein FRUB_01111 [Fimbriiglobus ruber]